ncbi:hypothetical protein UAJ10_02220 [Nitrospirillum sp. BR 11164]|uniref:hypothetical protein n=1 Tax=Nitrospirillum sp. BR 11164 TaxID=3104324 RepID=UPI002AFE086D|nr:hypothetical protein [Nitrospirillum sp. BR 11164]MEA1647835.1 hypothetical protein [Nitrospirillum sp. BR 11164]
MRIGELPLVVTRIKTTWVPAESSLDFSPRKGGQGSWDTTAATVALQAAGGLVLEYIAKTGGAAGQTAFGINRPTDFNKIKWVLC